MPLPAEVLATIPEDIRGSEHIAAYNDVGSLVRDLITVKTADWKSGLPDDLKTEKSLEGFKAVTDLAKGFVETKRLVGQTLRAPAADAPEEEWDKYYKAGGKPNAPEEYKFAVPDGLLTKEEEKQIREEAYREGLNSRQVQKRVDRIAEHVASVRKAEREEFERIDKGYREKWGANYPRNMALITATLERIDPDKTLRGILDASGLGNHPAIVEMILDKAKRLKEDNPLFGDAAGQVSRDDAKKKIAEINADLKHPYHKSKTGDPAFEEMRNLMQIAYD